MGRIFTVSQLRQAFETAVTNRVLKRKHLAAFDRIMGEAGTSLEAAIGSVKGAVPDRPFADTHFAGFVRDSYITLHEKKGEHTIITGIREHEITSATLAGPVGVWGKEIDVCGKLEEGQKHGGCTSDVYETSLIIIWALNDVRPGQEEYARKYRPNEAKMMDSVREYLWKL